MKAPLITVEILTDVCLIWLPIDLLILYSWGAWSDPIKAILWAELIMLPLISMLGVYRVIKLFEGLR